MIAIFDTNILISALLNPRSLPAWLVDEWIERRFKLATSEDQIAEFRRVSRYPKIAQQISGSIAGRLVRELRTSAVLLTSLPVVDICRDPMDDYLLAMAQVSSADYLVTGDKADLLSMRHHGRSKIITVRQFAEILAR
jgi:uncharacterized protein